MDKTMVLKPRVSEKSYALSMLTRTYVFEVPTTANKLSVKNAVEAQYKVTVTNVNVTNFKGKVKQSYRRGVRPVSGKRADTKRAYVTLKEGHSLPIFAAVETPPEPIEQKRSKKEAK